MQGTSPRYMDFEKTGAKVMMMTESDNQAFPIPYSTLPMGASSNGDPVGFLKCSC